jgi:hypothetical protein
MRYAGRSNSVSRRLATLAVLGAVFFALGSCTKNPVIPEEPDQPGDPKDPDGTAFRTMGDGFHFAGLPGPSGELA